MLAQAREWNRDCSRCRFILNTTGDLQPFESASVDLIYSRFVLQLDLMGGVTVPDVAGVPYQIQFTRSLRPPISWTNVTVISNGASLLPGVIFTNGSQGFYRAVLNQ